MPDISSRGKYVCKILFCSCVNVISVLGIVKLSKILYEIYVGFFHLILYEMKIFYNNYIFTAWIQIAHVDIMPII